MSYFAVNKFPRITFKLINCTRVLSFFLLFSFTQTRTGEKSIMEQITLKISKINLKIHRRSIFNTERRLFKEELTGWSSAEFQWVLDKQQSSHWWWIISGNQAWWFINISHLLPGPPDSQSTHHLLSLDGLYLQLPPMHLPVSNGMAV